MNTQKKVMLLIDADNVSADVIAQAVEMVHAEHGAIHVRRAYCTAESALANLKLFTTHSIRPIVNLSTGKNSTDIALAVDAIDLVLAERPDVAVIVSSDSDFAPLVIRLREKGCRVEGIGQLGKTGDDSKPVYDHFVDIAHRRSRAVEKTPARRTPARGRSRAAAPETASPAPPARATVAPATPSASAATPAAAPSPVAARPPGSAEPDAAAAPPAAPRRSRSTRSTRTRADGAAAPAPTDLPAAAPVPPRARPAPAAPAVSARAAMPDDLRRILAVLPELARGVKMELGMAAERLRSENLLSRSAPSTRLFKKFPDWFLLTPEQQPNKVEYRGMTAG